MKLSDNYAYDEEKKIWHGKKFHFAYSDGAETENNLLNILKRVYNKGLFSKELFKVQKDWVTTYYFSACRANLLRPFQKHFHSGSRVLELGCGCGALTRYLGECGAQVLAVEGSEKRAEIAALRCEGLENVTVLNENIQNLSSEKIGKFDVVTLIGVLEYARLFGGGKGAEVRMLETARSLLNENGILILAIENKLGLGYFAGYPEDHTNILWGSICNAYDEDGVMTYSRKELTEKLFQAGFVRLEQFVPVPDYKLPVSVITQKGLDSADRCDLAAICGYSFREYQELPLFNLGEAWKSVVDAGLLPELANSLCFVAYMRDNAAENNVLAEHYTKLSKEHKEYAKKMVIRDREGTLFCEREYLYPELQRKNNDIVHEVSNEPYYKGELAIDRIRRYVVKPGWTVQGLAHAFLPWYQYLVKMSSDQGRFLPPEAMDLTPFNMIIDEKGKICSFDLEWKARQKISFDLVLIRSVIVTFYKLGTVASPAEGVLLTFGFLLKSLCKVFGKDFSDEYIEKVLAEEDVLDSFIHGGYPDWKLMKDNTLFTLR